MDAGVQGQTNVSSVKTMSTRKKVGVWPAAATSPVCGTTAAASARSAIPSVPTHAQALYVDTSFSFCFLFNAIFRGVNSSE